MSAPAPPTSNGPRRPLLPPHLVGDTPPAPSRSPSNASTTGDISGGDPEDESADESDYPDGDPDDPHASTLELSNLGPAVATPKPSGASPWPFNAISAGGAGAGHASATSATAANGGSLISPTPEYALEQPIIPASSLPHEILLHILRLLPPASLAPALRVCKAWCQCGVELLWHKLSFTSVAALSKMLQVLSLPEQTFPYPDFVRRINFHPLASEMSDRVIAKLLPCTRLERITLTSCKSLSSAAMCALLVQSHRLVALDLTDVPNVDDDVLVALADNCPKVQGLNLSGCSKITDRGLEAIALGCPLLRRIKLRKCDLLTDVPVILLSLHCPLLLEVDLAFCSSVTSLAIMQLLRTSHALRELSLPGCVLLDDDAFPDANHLILLPPATRDDRESSPMAATPSRSGAASPADSGNVGGAAVSHDSASTSTASSSSTSSPPLLTSSGALIPRPTLLRSPPALRPYDHLRYLDVTACASLSDQSVAGIVKYCPRLRNLMLAKCIRLTDDALFAICGLGKHLHYLHLGHVSNVTDAAVIAIARACTRLRYIDLAYCRNLTDASVLELAANLPRLKRIGLVRVVSITDESLEALQARTSLERIHLSYCDNLTVNAVNEMLQALPRVTHLSLTGVSSFRKRALQQFCRAPPKDFNDHQRRSFCVFSGRGVHDLRKFLRSLGPGELAALALPDPPEDAMALDPFPLHQPHHLHHLPQQQQQQQQQRQPPHPSAQFLGVGFGMAAPGALAPQAQQQPRTWVGAGPGGAGAPAQHAALAQALQQQQQQLARAQAMVQARQAVALAAQRMQAAGVGGGGGGPRRPQGSMTEVGPGQHPSVGPSQDNMLGLQSLQHSPPALQEEGRSVGDSARSAPGSYGRFIEPAPRPGPALVASGSGGGDGRSNGPVERGRMEEDGHGSDGFEVPQQNVPIRQVAPRQPSLELQGLDEEDDTGPGTAALAGADGASVGGRPRRGTVTQSNYRSAVAAADGRRGSEAMEVEEDDEGGGDSDSGGEGEEEDVSMG